MSQFQASSPIEETVIIVGVGLIGGSLAAALKQRKLARTVIGVGRDAARMQAARAAGLIDEATTDLGVVIGRANLIVFCTPVDRVAHDVRNALSLSQGTPKPGILLTDVGSVKSSICQELAGVANFIGSHPIAGSHRQGFEAADANLFENRVCVITPTDISPAPELKRLEQLWQSIGMQTVRMTPVEHDVTLAKTSHLPHLIASALASLLPAELRHLTGTGFRDTTRIAAGDPGIWTAILENNADSVVASLEEFQEKLRQWKSALELGRNSEIRDLLIAGQTSRAALDKTPGGPDDIDS